MEEGFASTTFEEFVAAETKREAAAKQTYDVATVLECEWFLLATTEAMLAAVKSRQAEEASLAAKEA